MQATPAPTSPPQSPTTEAPTASQSYREPPPNVSSAPFGILVGLFERLQNERKHDRRRKLLDSWFTHWRNEKGYNLYPVLRLLLPQKDRERSVYGLKEKNLAKTYIKLIPLGMRDPDAIRLLNWKRPTERDITSGDFSTVLFEVVSKRSSVIEGSMSVDELNDILDELAKNMGKHDIQSKIMQRVYNRTTPAEQRWIVRIILKDMVISVKETTIFSVFHPDAQDLYNTCSDLKKVAYELWDTKYRLNNTDKTVQLFSSFAPMLCKRPLRKIEETVREMGGSEFLIEEKLDGERVQLHKRGNEYYYCSRKGKDYTYLYGKHVGAGSLTPYIDKAFDPRVEEIVLDGEMLVWDPVSERNLPFGTLKTAALDKSKKEHNPRPCFKVFDLLHLNGQSLLHRSTTFRKKNMRDCLKEVPGRIEFTEESKGKTAKDIRDKMDEVMASRGEGLVIKHPLSKYVLNGRNKDWIKVKPEYMDNMGETVDVLVVAGNYGTRKRSGGVSTLICAAFDDQRNYDDIDDDEPKYRTFVRVGTGFSFADYVWIRSKPWKKWDPDHPPAFLQTSNRSQDDKGDLYLNPEDSFIIKVKAAEITATDQYHLGYTMRFPRALSIRDDLSIGDCIQASTIFESMRTDRKRKMESDSNMTKKKRKIVTKKPTVLPQYSGPRKKDVAVESDIFAGMKFVVMSDPKSRTGDEDKNTLSKLIYANGGLCAQIPTKQAECYVVYGGTSIPYDLKLIMNKGMVDVIKPKWLIDSIEAGEKVTMMKKYFFHATEMRMARDDYDSGTDDDDEEVPEAAPAPAKASTSTPAAKDEDAEMIAPDAVKEEEIDPELAEWFKVDGKSAITRHNDSETEDDGSATEDDDSATEDDSNNEDVKNDPEEVDADLDDWLEVNKDDSGLGTEASSKAAGKQPEKDADVKMGETEDAMEYDEEHIFRHLCFYMDSTENAAKNGIAVKPSKYKKDIERNFSELTKLITENGGQIVGLDEPKLTHVIIDKRDESRRLELIKRTSKPKRRHLVISEYINACLDEGTLLDEDEFAP